MKTGKAIEEKRRGAHLFFCLSTVFTFFFFINGPVDANGGLKEKSRLYLSHLAADVVLDDLPGRQIPGIVEESTNRMLEDIEAHQQIANSEKITRQYLKDTASKVLDRELRLVQERFNAVWGESEYKTRAEAALEAFISKQGRAIFKGARDAAVTTQLDRVTLKTYPTEKQVMDLDAAGWSQTEVDVLKKHLAVRMRNQKEFLFEEVKEAVGQRVDEVYQDIQSQMAAQREAVSTFKPDTSLVSQEQIINAWKATLEQTRQSLKKNVEAWQKVYPVFPSIEDEISSHAAEMEQRRFHHYIVNGDLSSILDSEEIASTVREDGFTHKRRRDSLSHVVSTLLPKVIKGIVEERVSAASQADRAAYLARISSHYLPRLNNDIQVRLEAYVKPVHDTVRQQLSEQQMRLYFPTIADWTWELAGEKNERIAKRYAHDEDLSVNTIDDCLSEPIISSITSSGEVPTDLLEETESSVLDRTRALLNEMSKAWKGQNRIYRTQEKYIRIDVDNKIDLESEMRKRAELSEDELVTHFMREIDDVWKKHRIGLVWGTQRLPEYRTKKYLNLFEYIRNRIESDLRNGIETVKVKLVKERENEERERKRREENRRKVEEEQRKEAQEETAVQSEPIARSSPAVTTKHGTLDSTMSGADVGSIDLIGSATDSAVVQKNGILTPPDMGKASDNENGSLGHVVMTDPLSQAGERLYWLALLALVVMAAIAIWIWSQRAHRIDSSKESTESMHSGSVENSQSVGPIGALRSKITEPDTVRTLLVILVLLEFLALLYLVIREPFTPGLLSTGPVQLYFDETESKPGEFFFKGEGYFLKVESPNWAPPDDTVIELRHE